MTCFNFDMDPIYAIDYGFRVKTVELLPLESIFVYNNDSYFWQHEDVKIFVSTT
jgi:hypothetical protein